MEVDIELRIHERILDSIDVLGKVGLSMSSHDHFMAVSIDMSLAERDRLCQHIIACTHQVNIENLMVFDKTKYSLIEVTSALGAESYDDSLGGVGLDSTSSGREWEKIVLICEKLKRGWQIAVIDDIEQTVSCALNLNLAKLDSFRRQLDIIAISDTLAAEFNRVATEGSHFELSEAGYACNLRSVRDSYFCDLTGANFTLCVIDLNGKIFAIIFDLLNQVVSGHIRWVLQVEDLAGSLAH